MALIKLESARPAASISVLPRHLPPDARDPALRDGHIHQWRPFDDALRNTRSTIVSLRRRVRQNDASPTSSAAAPRRKARSLSIRR